MKASIQGMLEKLHYAVESSADCGNKAYEQKCCLYQIQLKE